MVTVFLKDRAHILTDLQELHLRSVHPTPAPGALALVQAEIQDLILLRDIRDSQVAHIHSSGPAPTVGQVATRISEGTQDTGQVCQA